MQVDNTKAAAGDGLVTVYIPTFNQAGYLNEAVRSALGQTVRPAAVIVGDDASTDDTPAVLSALAASDPLVRCVRQPTNLGMAGNNACLIESVNTEFTIRLDSDDRLEPTFLADLLPLMRAHPRAGYGHGAIRRMDAAGCPTYTIYLNRRQGYQEPDVALRAGVTGYRVAGNIVMYRTQAVREVNFFYGRPDYVSDYDMAVRLAVAGWGNVYADRVVANYRTWADAGGLRVRRKASELDGYVRIFDEVLTPAFAARGWDAQPLARQRRRLALDHAANCFLPQYDAEDRRHLVALLRRLGPSRGLEVKLRLLGLGLAPLVERLYHAKGRTKNLVKQGLAQLRRRRDVPTSDDQR